MAEEERLTEIGERLSQVGERPAVPGELPTAAAHLICAGSELAEGGDGVRFEIEREGESTAAFIIRYGGRAYAYLNRCGHIAMELDWKPGKFFDADGEYLICSTHGALYMPESGACLGGPCRGAGLVALEVFESDGGVYLKG
ncbi:MAG: Rieske 2Fe-2S domain-containing protein [Pseudomonadota bacterium]